MALYSVGVERAGALGAYCLDGSVPHLWYEPPAATTPAGLANRSWHVFLDGGAWCYDESSCESRSRGYKGTSKGAPLRNWPYSGPLDRRPSVNPTFSGFHRLNLAYCDGGSYLGDRAAPLRTASGATLYFRGRRVLQAQIDLALELGMRDADEVLFSGGSAGGIGALAAADWVRRRLPSSVRRFKVLIISSFFVMNTNTPGDVRPGAVARGRARTGGARVAPAAGGRRLGIGGVGVADDGGGVGGGGPPADAPTCVKGRGAPRTCVPWATKMRRMTELHNASGALTAGGCGAGMPVGARWRCLFGTHAAGHVASPLFVINSALDSWQLVNVWRRYARCRWEGTQGCNATHAARDVAESNAMLRSFVSELTASGALSRPGNGAFIHSCNEHVAGLTAGGFERYAAAADGVTMRQALAAWWAAPDNAPAAPHTRMPCELRASPPPPPAASASGRRNPLAHHHCNPSCALHNVKRRLSQECPCDPPK